jgi:hypothetical protein
VSIRAIAPIGRQMYIYRTFNQIRKYFKKLCKEKYS